MHLEHEKMRMTLAGFQERRHACDACACLLPRGGVQ